MLLKICSLVNGVLKGPHGCQYHFISSLKEVTVDKASCLISVASMQTIGATGACHMGARLLKEHYPPWKHTSCSKIYLSKDTWGRFSSMSAPVQLRLSASLWLTRLNFNQANHGNIFKALGIELIEVPYYDSYRKSFNWERFKAAIETLPQQSVVLIQTAAHNPTGCDPTSDQWHQLAQIFLARRHFAFLDAAYLGLISGDPELDAQSIRIFANAGVPLLLAGTLGKSFGLYGERVGIMSALAPSQKIQKRIEQHMKYLARSESSAPPSFGAKIVEIVLNNESIQRIWRSDVKDIAIELSRRRAALREELQTLKTPGDWRFLTAQVGMFS